MIADLHLQSANERRRDIPLIFQFGSVERAMKKFPHVSKRTVWDDVTAEMEDLQADGTTRVFLREPRIGPGVGASASREDAP